MTGAGGMMIPPAPPVEPWHPLRSVADARSPGSRVWPARSADRVVPERGDLAGSPEAVGGAAPVALPAVRDPDPPGRQRSGAVVAPPAREVPALRESDRRPVPPRGGGLRSPLRRRRRSVRVVVGAPRLPGPDRRPAGHLDHRPR